MNWHDLPGPDRQLVLRAYQAGLQYARIDRALFALSLDIQPGYVRLAALPGFMDAYCRFLREVGGDVID